MKNLIYQTKNQVEEIKTRLNSPTPKFFRVLRNAALVVGAVASTLFTAGIAPAVTGIVAAVSASLVTVSQLTKETE